MEEIFSGRSDGIYVRSWEECGLNADTAFWAASDPMRTSAVRSFDHSSASARRIGQNRVDGALRPQLTDTVDKVGGATGLVAPGAARLS